MPEGIEPYSIESDDENIHGQSVVPNEGFVEVPDESPIEITPVSLDGSPIAEEGVPIQYVNPIPEGSVISEESVRVQEVVDYIRQVDTQTLETAVRILGLKVEPYTNPIQRILQEIGLVSCTGELPSFLKDKISGEFKVNENLRLALKTTLLDDEIVENHEYSLVTLDNEKLYLIGKAKYVLKQTGPELDVEAKVVGLAFELEGKTSLNGFGVYDENGVHTLYTDKLNVYNVVQMGYLENINFHGKMIFGYALLSDYAYLKGYFILSRDSIVDEVNGITVADLLENIGALEQYNQGNDVTIANIQSDLTSMTQSINSIEDNIEVLSTSVEDILSDGVIDAREKRTLRVIWLKLVSDKEVADNHAEFFNVGVERDDMLTAFYQLALILNNNEPYTTGLPYIINDDNINISSPINRTEYNTKFDAYWNALKILLDKLRVEINNSVDNVYQYALLINGYVEQINVEIAEQQVLINNISSDAMVTPAEKLKLSILLQEITNDYNSDIAHANSYGVSTDSYTTAYTNLQAYINGILNDENDITPITVNEYVNMFDAYFNARKELVNSINTSVRRLMDDLSDMQAELMVENSLIEIRAEEVIARLRQITSDGIIGYDDLKTINGIIRGVELDYGTIETHLEILGELNSPIFTNYTSKHNDFLGKLTTIKDYLIEHNPPNDTNPNDNNYDFAVQTEFSVEELITSAEDNYSAKSEAFGIIPFTIEYGLNDATSIANGAIQQANSALEMLDAIGNNNIISKSEKKGLLKEWNIIVEEVNVYKDYAIANQVSSSSYEAAYLNIGKFLDNNPGWTPPNVPNALYLYDQDTDITSYSYNGSTGGVALKNVFKDYYIQKIALLNTISNITNSAVRDMADDSKLTPSEKITLRAAWNKIVDIRSDLMSYQSTYDIDELQELSEKFQALANYLNGGTTWSSGYPLWINDANMDVTTSVVRDTFNGKFNDFYKAESLARLALNDIAFDDIGLINAVATAAATAAANAQTSANTANALLADIAADNKLTPVEKSSVRAEWDTIAAEKSVNDAQADTFGIITEKSTYGTKFQTLATYLNNGTTWSSGIPSWIADANLGTTTDIVGATFRLKFKEYYDARTALLNAIAAKAKTLADNAQTTANSAQTAASNAQTTANTALTNANNALTQLTNIASDNILSPVEKQSVKREWDDIVNEKQKIVDQAYPYYDVSTTAYTNAYDALNTYITPLLSNLNSDSTINGPTFRSKFNSYYLERQNLLNSIAEQARRVAKNGGNFLDWQQLQLCNYPITSAAYTNFATGIYGDAAENAIVLAETPFGTIDKVWECKTAAADGGAGGGFNTTRNVRIDPSKSYIFFVWIKAFDVSNIYNYFGVTSASNKVINLNTSAMDSNPYFVSAYDQRDIPLNRWLLLAGVVHGKDYTGTGVRLSGIYDPLTKRKLFCRTKYVEFKWYDANVNSIAMRVLRAGANTVNSKLQIYGAGIYEMNGQEPSVYSLLTAAKVTTIPVKPADANLKAYYSFDKNILFDDSGNGKGLTQYGTRPINHVASDIKGKCLYFNISDTTYGYLAIDDSAYFRLPEITISLWFKFTGYSGAQTASGILSMPYTPGLRVVKDGSFNYLSLIVSRTSDSANLVTSAYHVEENKWYHVTVMQKTGAGGYAKLYVNGNLIDAYYENIKYGSGTMMVIGTDFNNPTDYRFNGYIDEFRYYNKILTDEEIAWLYLNPTQGLDYGSLKTIIDGGLVSSGTIQVGQGNDGDYTVKAGITGEGSADSSVRIWAGNTFTGRSVAPFRVQQDGTMYASKGFVGVWEILDNVLQSVVSGKKMIIDPVKQRIVIDDNGTIKVKIVSSNLPALSTLLNPQTVTYYFNYQRTNTSEIPDYFTNYYSFAPDKVLNCKYRFWYSYENLFAQKINCRFTLSIYLCNTDNSRIRLLGSATKNIYNTGQSSYIDIDLGYINNGSYKLEFSLYVADESYNIVYEDLHDYLINAPGELIVGNNGSNQTYITGTQTETGNIIGTDGVAFFAGAAKYFYLNFSTDEFLQILGKVRLSNSGSGLLFDSDMMKNLKYWRGSVYNIKTVGSSTQITNLNYEYHIFTGATSNPSPVIMPQRTHVKNTFGFSDTDKFAIRMAITYVGSSNSIKVYGRNTVYSNQNTPDFPYMWDNNGSYTLTDGTTVAKGDVLELLLCYDGTTFFAVRLNYRT